MFYIFLTSQATPGAAEPDKLIRLEETVTRRTDETGILRLYDIDAIIWKNLERIDAPIYADFKCGSVEIFCFAHRHAPPAADPRG